MKIDVLGVKIDDLTREQVVHRLKNLLVLPKPVFIVTPYSESIVAAQRDAEFRNILNSADLSLPDGMGVVWAANFLGAKLPEKISGSDFVWDLAEIAADYNFSIYLLGGYGDTPKLAAAKLKSKFPNLKIAGTSNAPGLSFPRRRESIPLDAGSKSGMTDIINEIDNSRADFLLVALGPVRQEKWIAENLPDLRVKLAIGLGGTFDYLAGKRPPAPRILRVTGLEWLWRLLTQPWRVIRIFKGVLGLIYYSTRYIMKS
ncbi:MAG: WecB/TagA/CpsF family glycosyltransferase [Candidatus Doudnabacteria bacterium]|nr:WecB/TagA/CpsF family glycosyltransferase [Candidatus Doudnabacteria bacterium]